LAKRLIEFLRSVAPADPFQLLFLTGVVCLVTLHGVWWWPSPVHVLPDRMKTPFGSFVYYAGTLFIFPAIFAAAAGYFSCFWPGKHPIRRILVSIVFPTIFTVVLALGRFVYLTGPASTILQNTGLNAAGELKWIRFFLSDSLAFHVSLIGLVLVFLFILRLSFGISSLPLTIANHDSQPSSEHDGGDWQRVLRMIWFLIALSNLLHGFLTALVVFSVPAAFRVRGMVTVAINVSAICNATIALWIAGPRARKTTRQSIVTPVYKWTGIAFLLPLALEVVLFLLQAAIKVLNLGNAAADDIVSDTFYLPHFIGMFLTLVIPAFCEEILFRGLLQKRFIDRYGMYRGVFLACITWAAFHFYSDFMNPHHSYRDILTRLTGRIVTTLGVGFVLSWLSLRSGSIVPATLSHALYNALLFAPLLPPVGRLPLLRTMLWAASACILFRFWPPPVNPDLEIVATITHDPRPEESRAEHASFDPALGPT
jgi:membrane protease YdiL (CAAX protease family)